jgi:AraC-like DNA-binding protein
MSEIAHFLSGIAMLCYDYSNIGQMPAYPLWQIEMHAHNHNELIIITGGMLHIWTETGKRYDVQPGDVIIYPAGYGHKELSDSKMPEEHIYIPFQGPNWDSIVSVFDEQGRILTLCQWMLEAGQCSYSGREQLFAAYLNVIIEEVKRLQMVRSDPLVQKARHFMVSNLSANISLDDIAHAVTMSKYHFIREYKRICGRSPIADLRSIRLEKAKSLLITTILPLKVIAPMVGFSNENHLSRMFPKYLGFPAKHFRKTSR